QILGAAGRAFFLPEEGNVWRVLLKPRADGSLDLNIKIGHHVPVAFGMGGTSLVVLGNVGGGVHGAQGSCQQRPCVVHSGLTSAHSEENTASNMGNRPRSGQRGCSTNVGESTPRWLGR